MTQSKEKVKYFAFLTERKKYKQKKPAPFKFKAFSKKQKQVLTWWREGSPVKVWTALFATIQFVWETIVMSLSYIMWEMETFKDEKLGMAGKTIGSFSEIVAVSLITDAK